MFARAILIMLQALRAQPQYSWAGAFSGLVILFNPIWPIAFPHIVSLTLDLTGICLFVFYITLRKTRLRPALKSIADRNPQLRSL